MTSPNVAEDRLPPLRSIRLNKTIALRMVGLARDDPERASGAIGVALACTRNIRDSVAVLREHQP